MKSKVKSLIKTSKEVIQSCQFKNGAIIAADVFNPIYPKDVRWYGYVWLRDASFTCMAADVLGMYHLADKFFDWLQERLERVNGFILAHKYHPNGLIAGDTQPIVIREKDIIKKALRKTLKAQLKAILAYSHYQSDQLGALLIAIHNHRKYTNTRKKYNALIINAADSISHFWNNDHFTLPIVDLWEEMVVLPTDRKYIAYTLAMCIRGLECAVEMIKSPKKKWYRDIEQMKNILNSLYDEKLKIIMSESSFELGESFTAPSERHKMPIDSSLLGLVWPAQCLLLDDIRIKHTVKRICEVNAENCGVYRYQGDTYTGKEKFLELDLNYPAGYWPLLNFWMSIVLCKMGEREEALTYYNKVLKSVDRFIPEQIFQDKNQKLVMPLCWSHSMFILASKELGFI